MKKAITVLTSAVLMAGIMLSAFPASAAAATTNAPAAPIVTKATYKTKAKKVIIKWKAVSGANGYQVKYKAGSAWKTKNTTARKVTVKKTASSTVKFKVRAYKTVSGKKVYGKYSNTITVKKAAAYKASKKPAKVSGVAVSNKKTNQLTMSWSAVPNAKAYQLFRKAASGGSWKKVKTSATPSFTDKGLKAGTKYQYKVRAVSSKGKYGAYSPVKSVTTTKATSSNNGGNGSNSGDSGDTGSNSGGSTGNHGTAAPTPYGRYQKITLGSTTGSFSVTGGQQIYFSSKSEMVSTTTSNHCIVRITSSEGEGQAAMKCIAYATSKGTATITIKLKNGSTYVYKVTVTSNDTLYYPYDNWRQSWIKANITAGLNDRQKVEKAAFMIIDTFPYGNIATAPGMYQSGYGSCFAGALMLQDFCTDFGIKAITRSAENDPINYGQLPGHLNCLVTMGGRQYVVDATPAAGTDTSGGVIVLEYTWG